MEPEQRRHASGYKIMTRADTTYPSTLALVAQSLHSLVISHVCARSESRRTYHNSKEWAPQISQVRFRSRNRFRAARNDRLAITCLLYTAHPRGRVSP